MASQRVAIGIDLGTTYSCVAAYLNGKVEVIANDQGNRITPSYVAFTDTDRLIGDAAKEQIAQNPENTIFDVKRIIGRKFNDETVQDDIERWPFTVTDKKEKPVIVVEHEEQVKEYTPEQISAMVLGKMKEVAETFIGAEVTDAVITVPAYFDNSQRQATKDAGKIAGLNVLQIISEPTAAALAYGIQRNVVDKKNVLIFDLGGGTFDVAILEMQKGNFKVKAKSGDTHLGGEDFDGRLVDYFTQEIKRKLKKDLSDKRAIQRLKKECEKGKRVLASSTKTNIDIECLIDGEDYHASLTRGRFEQLCGDLFEKTLDIVETTLEDSGLDKDDLDEIVLVGGSTRIKKIQSLLEEFFESRKMNMTINPDEAVAYGAAIHAAVLTGVIPAEDVQQSDVNPLSLGVETVCGRMSTVIERNTKIPVKRVKQNYTTFKDNQKTMEIKVFEGEDGDTARNHLLGSFILTNIQKAPRAVPSIDITFTLDANGILNVSAVDRATKCEGHITIKSNTGRLGARAMDRMIAEGRSLDAADRRRKDCEEARNSLESYCFSAKTTVQNRSRTAGRITDQEREEVLEACNAALEWMEDNEQASEQQLAEEKRQLVGVCQPVLSQLV